jgi:hypothetical protein
MKHLPPIDIRIIPHKDQIYETAGNYGEDGCGWWMEISKMEDWRYEAMCAMHELLEMILTKAQGVDWKDIDNFDMTGEGKDMDDPGISPKAPYHTQHLAAMRLEKDICKIMGIPWYKYDRSYSKLVWRKKK